MDRLLVGFESAKCDRRNFRDCISWTDLQFKNLADYDEIIINLGTVADFIPLTDGAAHIYRTIFTHEKIIEAIGNQCNFTIIGKITQSIVPGVPFSNILPFKFDVDFAGGKSIALIDESEACKNFFRKITSWESAYYNIRPKYPDTIMLDAIPIAVNKSDRFVSFELQCWQSNGPKLGRMTFLPNPGVESASLLDEILAFYDSNDDSLQPEWLEKFQVPGQSEVDSELILIAEAISQAERKQLELMHSRELLRGVLKLIYTDGRELEEAVLKAFEFLGAEVERPTKPNEEDGWIKVATVPNGLGVLEIKSTKSKMFDEKGLAQVGKWQLKSLQERREKYKGIYVGSSLIGSHPNDRPNPFSGSFIKLAKLQQTAVLKCEDLLRAVMDHQTGQLKINEFWASLFETEGIFEYPKEGKDLVISSACGAS